MPLHDNWQKMSKIISKAIAQAWLDDDFRKNYWKNRKRPLSKWAFLSQKG
jgi:hypothetical protein